MPNRNNTGLCWDDFSRSLTGFGGKKENPEPEAEPENNSELNTDEFGLTISAVEKPVENQGEPTSDGQNKITM